MVDPIDPSELTRTEISRLEELAQGISPNVLLKFQQCMQDKAKLEREGIAKQRTSSSGSLTPVQIGNHGPNIIMKIREPRYELIQEFTAKGQLNDLEKKMVRVIYRESSRGLAQDYQGSVLDSRVNLLAAKLLDLPETEIRIAQRHYVGDFLQRDNILMKKFFEEPLLQESIAELPDEFVQSEAQAAYQRAMNLKQPKQRAAPKGIRRALAVMFRALEYASLSFESEDTAMSSFLEIHKFHRKRLNPIAQSSNYHRAVLLARYFHLGEEALNAAAESLVNVYLSNSSSGHKAFASPIEHFEMVSLPQEYVQEFIQERFAYGLAENIAAAKQTAEHYEVALEELRHPVRETYAQWLAEGRLEKAVELHEAFPDFLMDSRIDDIKSISAVIQYAQSR